MRWKEGKTDASYDENHEQSAEQSRCRIGFASRLCIGFAGRLISVTGVCCLGILFADPLALIELVEQIIFLFWLTSPFGRRLCAYPARALKQTILWLHCIAKCIALLHQITLAHHKLSWTWTFSDSQCNLWLWCVKCTVLHVVSAGFVWSISVHTSACPVKITVHRIMTHGRAEMGIGKRAVEFATPKFSEPGIPLVCPRIQWEIIVIKPVNIRRLDSHWNSSYCFLLHPGNHVRSVGPPITGTSQIACINEKSIHHPDQGISFTATKKSTDITLKKWMLTSQSVKTFQRLQVSAWL